jgi:hypothetical protein
VGFLPYLHNVLTLPLAVFMRSYSIYFLQQFDSRYTMMTESQPVVMGFPVTYGQQQPYPPYQQPLYQPPPPPPGGDLPR